MKPPYTITPEILRLLTAVSERIGEVNATYLQRPPAILRKSNRIRTIHATLQIEGNTLTIGQVTDIIENKRVIAPKKDILEVKNAVNVYEHLIEFKSAKISSLLKAHQLLMNGLIDSAGKFRAHPVGIVKGEQVKHLAPGGEMVKPLMNDLFHYLKNDPDPDLIKSCVFHYELEFIHPFSDGNGRIGRLWQTIILKEKYPVFEFLPLENIIREKQEAYYRALSESDRSGNSTSFIGFMLGVIAEALQNLLSSQRSITMSGNERMTLYQCNRKDLSFTRKDYMTFFKQISQATASRDLKEAVEKGLLLKTGDKNTSSYLWLDV